MPPESRKTSITFLYQIILSYCLQSQTYIPSCVFGLVLVFFSLFVMIKPDYMAYFTGCWFCCFAVFFYSVKRLHDRICCPWMSFQSHLYFRGIYDFLCARIQHKPFMKLRKTFLALPKCKCCHEHLVQKRASPGTVPQIHAHASWWEFLHAKSQNLTQSRISLYH